MTGPSRKRARRGLPHIANARNGVVRLAERVLEGHLAADLAVPRPSKAVGRSCSTRPAHRSSTDRPSSSGGLLLEYAARTPLRAGQRSASSKPGYFPGCPGFFFAKSRCDVVISHPLPRHRRNRKPPPQRRKARGRAARRRNPPDLVELAHEDVDGGRRADAQRAPRSLQSGMLARRAGGPVHHGAAFQRGMMRP